jgi:hypothetical protein
MECFTKPTYHATWPIGWYTASASAPIVDSADLPFRLVLSHAPLLIHELNLVSLTLQAELKYAFSAVSAVRYNILALLASSHLHPAFPSRYAPLLLR